MEPQRRSDVDERRGTYGQGAVVCMGMGLPLSARKWARANSPKWVYQRKPKQDADVADVESDRASPALPQTLRPRTCRHAERWRCLRGGNARSADRGS